MASSMCVTVKVENSSHATKEKKDSWFVSEFSRSPKKNNWVLHIHSLRVVVVQIFIVLSVEL